MLYNRAMIDIWVMDHYFILTNCLQPRTTIVNQLRTWPGTVVSTQITTIYIEDQIVLNFMIALIMSTTTVV